MEQKSLGIIGGMGPKATSVFFDKIIESTEAHRDQDHINMVILNHATLPDRTTAILTGHEAEFLEAIQKDIRILEVAGVANIAIPCNTSHYFYEQIQQMTEINIINMVDETIKAIYNKYGEGTKVGILATNGTIRSGIYKAYSDQYSLQLHVPNRFQQDQVMNIIYNNVKGENDIDSSELEALIQELIYQEKCQTVILACTELSCIPLRKEINELSIDAMEVLVRKSIELSGKKVKNR